jgi:hypothetical protein
MTETFPGLQGGLRRNATENRLQPLEVAILLGSLPRDLFADVLGQGRSEELFRQWRDSALVKDIGDGYLRLTGNGSWFAERMMARIY